MRRALATRKRTGSRPDLGPPAYLVLGMVSLGSRSGYDIKRAVESSIRFFWTISHAQIYPSLKRLERAHLIKGRYQPLGKRARRVFEVTPAGEAALKDWLRRDDPMPFELRDIGLVKLFFADALDRGDAAALIAAIKRRSEERNVTLASIAPSAEDKQTEGNTIRCSRSGWGSPSTRRSSLSAASSSRVGLRPQPSAWRPLQILNDQATLY